MMYWTRGRGSDHMTEWPARYAEVARAAGLRAPTANRGAKLVRQPAASWSNAARERCARQTEDPTERRSLRTYYPTGRVTASSSYFAKEASA